MRLMPKRPKIEDEGLKKWLNRRAHEHNDYNYDDFVKMKDVLNKSSLGALFGVNRKTIDKWLKIYEREDHGNQN